MSDIGKWVIYEASNYRVISHRNCKWPYTSTWYDPELQRFWCAHCLELAPEAITDVALLCRTKIPEYSLKTYKMVKGRCNE
jgi:hypothetical protein